MKKVNFDDLVASQNTADKHYTIKGRKDNKNNYTLNLNTSSSEDKNQETMKYNAIIDFVDSDTDEVVGQMTLADYNLRLTFSGESTDVTVNFDIPENWNLQSCTIFNGGGKVTLKKEINAESLTIYSKQLKTTKNSNFHINEKTHIYADEEILLCGNIISTNIFSIYSKGKITLNRLKLFSGNCTLESMAAIISEKEVGLIADNIKIVAPAVCYAKDCAMLATYNVSVTAEKFFLRGKLVSGKIIFEVKDKLIIEIESEVVGGSQVSISAGNIDNYGKIHSNGVTYLNIQDEARFFVGSLIRGLQALFIDCEKGINHGKLISNGGLVFRANKHIVNGPNLYDISNLQDLKKLGNLASITAKKVSIVAGCYLNMAGYVNGTHMLNIASLAHFEILALNQAWRNIKNNLISIDASVDIPDFAPIKEIFKKLYNFDFSSVLSDNILTKETAFQTLSLLVSSLKLLVPHLGMVVGILWNTLLLSINIPRITSEVRHLYNNWEKVQLRDIIPVAVGFKNLIIQTVGVAVAGVTSIEEFISTGLFLSDPIALSGQDAVQVVEMLASMFGPSISRDSLFSVVFGADFTGNNSSRAIASFEANVQLSQNTNQTSVYSCQASLIRTNTLIQEGVRADSYSDTRANSVNITEVGSYNQHSHSRMRANQGVAMVGDLKQSGKMEFKTGSVNVRSRHNIDKEGQYKQDGGSYQSDETQDSGIVQVNTTAMKVNKMEVEKDAKLTMNNSTMTGRTFIVDGQSNLKNVEMKLSGDYCSTASSNNDVDNVDMRVNNAQFGGRNALSNVTVQATNTVDISPNSSMKITNIVGVDCQEFKQSSPELTIDGQLVVKAQEVSFSEDSNTQASAGEIYLETPTIDFSGKIDAAVLVAETKNISQSEPSEISAQQLSFKAEEEMLQEGYIEAIEGFFDISTHEMASTAHLKTDSGYYKAKELNNRGLVEIKNQNNKIDKITNEGTIKFTNTNTTVDETITNKPNSTMSFVHANVTTDRIDNKGLLDFDDFYLMANNVNNEKGAEIHFQNGKLTVAGDLSSDGLASFDFVDAEMSSLQNTDQLVAEKTHLNVRDEIKSAGVMTTNQSQVDTRMLVNVDTLNTSETILNVKDEFVSTVDSTTTTNKTEINVQSAKISGETSLNETVLDVEDELTLSGIFSTNSADISAKNITSDSECNSTKTSFHAEGDFLNTKSFTGRDTYVETKNFENQDKMDLDNSAVKTEIFQTTDDNNMRMKNVEVESIVTTISGVLSTDTTQIKSADSLTLTEHATVNVAGDTSLLSKTIHDSASTFIADSAAVVFQTEGDGNIIADSTSSFNGENGTLIMSSNNTITLDSHGDVDSVYLKADKVNNLVEVVAGSGEHEGLSIESALVVETKQDINLNQKIQRDSAVQLSANNLAITEDQDMSKSFLVNANGNLDVHANVHADEDVSLQATENITTDAHKVSAGHDLNINAAKSYVASNSKLSAGHDLYANADTQMHLIGSEVQGNNYVQMTSHGDITNEALAKQVQGRYDTMYQYTSTQVIGGQGEGHDGNGLVIQTEGQFVNTASNISAQGNAVISADKGVQVNALTHTYVSNKKTKKHGFLKQKTSKVETRTTQVQCSDISSKQGSVYMSSKDGGMKIDAAHLSAAKDVELDAKKDIVVRDVIAKQTTKKTSKSLFGHSKSKRSDEYSVPTKISSHDNIKMSSHSGDVSLRSVVMASPGPVTIEGRNVNIDVSILKHTYSCESSGFGVSVMGQEVAHTHLPQQTGSGVHLPATPIIDQAKNLHDAQGLVETTTETFNSAITLANTTNNIVNGLVNDNLPSQIFKTHGIGLDIPTTKISYTHTSSKESQETKGPGVIAAGSLTINAKESVNITGVTVAVAQDMTVNAKDFKAEGVKLHSESEQKTQNVSVATSIKGSNSQVGVSGSVVKMEADTVLNQHTYVGGTLHVNVNNMELIGANIDAEKVDIHVKDTLTITSMTDSMTSSSTHASLSTDQSFSCGHDTSSSSIVNEKAGIHTHEAITKNNFQADTLHTLSGDVVSDTSVELNVNTIISESIHEEKRGSGFSIAGNIHDLIPQKPSSNRLPADMDMARQIHTVDVGIKSEHYDANLVPVVHGHEATIINANSIQGEIHTGSLDGRSVQRDTKHNINVKIPVYDKQTIDQMKHNFNYALEELGLVTPSIDTIAYRSFESMKTSQDVEQYLKELNVSLMLSKASYDPDAPMPEGYALLEDGGYYDSTTGTKVETFINEESHEIVIAFRGTANVANLATADVDIATRQAPRSYNADMEAYIKETMTDYPDYQVSFTGHSLGAAEAALASSQFNKPAYVFDNPGIYNPNNQYDFSKVTDFESRPNVVNGAGSLTGTTYDKGKVLELPSTAKYDVEMELGKLLPAPSEIIISTTSHQLKTIEEEVHQYTDTIRSQLEYNNAHANLSVVTKQPKTINNNRFTLFSVSSENPNKTANEHRTRRMSI